MGWVYNASSEVASKSRYPLVISICVVLTFLMICTVSLRIFLHVRARRVAVDDYMVLFSMIFSVIYNALCITQTRYGLGLPLAQRPKPNLSTYMKVNFAGRPFYQIGIAGFKAALCFSYLRLLSGTTKKAYKFFIWAVGTISTLGHIAGALVLILNCQPVSKSWNPRVKGTCLPFGPTNYGLAGFTIACDIIIILLPIPLLLALHIRAAQKAGLMCLFLLGLFTTICSILRLTQIPVIAYGNGDSTMLVLWGTIEFNIGNIISSLPFLAPLLKRFIGGFRSQLGYSRSNRYNTGDRYVLQSFSKGQHKSTTTSSSMSHVITKVKRTPSEELILGASDPLHDGGITRTVEYRVSMDKGSEASREPHSTP